MKRLLFLTVLCLFLANFTFSQKVSKEDVMKVGLNFYKHNAKELNLTKSSYDVSNYAVIKSNSGDEAIHVLNFGNDGFVLVSGDMSVTPILAYSYESTFDMSNMAPATKSWIQNYVDQFEEVTLTKSNFTGNYKEIWKDYISNNFEDAGKSEKSVYPMLTTYWDQGKFYNYYCPEHPSATRTDGKCYTGCVATAMAQILNYHKSPVEGKGIVSYYWDKQYEVDLSDTEYDWEHMPSRLLGNVYGRPRDSVEMRAVAKLMFHCGISVGMNYGPSSSGANSQYVPSAFLRNFDFRAGTKYISRYDVPDDNEWKYLIKNELNLNRPVYYSGSNDTVGHAFVCDGYTGDFFHFNWGWSGYLDGYFYIDNITTDNSHTYPNSQGIVIGAAPKAVEYPYCGKNNVITFVEGTLEDGSDQNYYLPNTNCEWWFSYTDLNSEQIKFDSLKFTFNKFSILSGDKLSFYDITDPDNRQLIASYTGSDIPPTSFNTISKEVLVTFVTGATQGEGWEIMYEVVAQGSGNVGVEDHTLSNIKIFPNPAYDVITFEGLEMKNTSVGVYDISGKQLMNANNLNNNSLNISALSNGVYFIKINNDKNTRTVKIIKQ